MSKYILIQCSEMIKQILKITLQNLTQQSNLKQRNILFLKECFTSRIHFYVHIHGLKSSMKKNMGKISLKSIMQK